MSSVTAHGIKFGREKYSRFPLRGFHAQGIRTASRDQSTDRGMMHPSTVRVILVLALVVVTRVQCGGAIETSFWVWHRSSPLSADEIAQLQQQHVRDLYWHIGELEHREGTWCW